ncbi:acetyl-coenzym A synthetase [Pelomyxa schiedti]|nr:acetyl-coenzym A synthetase [Pelomyxa schiedti]
MGGPNSAKPIPFSSSSASSSASSSPSCATDAISGVYDVPSRCTEASRIPSPEEYQRIFADSIREPDRYWAELGSQYLHWFKPFTSTRQGTFFDEEVSWFRGGKLNACYNCLDRWLPDKGNQLAVIWEGDQPTQVCHITFKQLHKQVCAVANILKSVGVSKGDVVTIFMTNCPEAIISMLACARIGAIHSVVFFGFGADELVSRVTNCSSKTILTVECTTKAGRIFHLKRVVDEVVRRCPCLSKVLVFKNSETCPATPSNLGTSPAYTNGMEFAIDESVLNEPLYSQPCPCEWMDSGDSLFVLYTSGSTGVPKGLVHSTAGYLLYAAATTALAFDLRQGDLFAAVVDVGWITGHTYMVYGPLSLGCTTFLFQGTPMYPTPSRYWEMCQRHRFTHFYTSPVAIRSLMRYSSDHLKPHDRSSLRIMSSVGECLNPDAWKWFFEEVGDRRCILADTYWQTESGGVLLSPIPGCSSLKVGSCGMPFFGIMAVVLDPVTGVEYHRNDVQGLLAIKNPWPGTAKTIFGNHAEFLEKYFSRYPGYYLTGDWVIRDKDGYYFVMGRVEDLINVSGRRVGSTDVENALLNSPSILEAAAVGIPNPHKGESIVVFCTLRMGEMSTPELLQSLKSEVRLRVGALATPDTVVITNRLPKTRSGKTMRRLLRNIAIQCGGGVSSSGRGLQCETPNEEDGHLALDTLGDLSTLTDVNVVPELVEAFRRAVAEKNGKL